MTVFEIETPYGLARAHLHAAKEPRAALILGHGAAGAKQRRRLREMYRNVGLEQPK